MEIINSQVPHKYRNRFLRDSGGNVSIVGGSSAGSSTVITNEFEPHNLWGQYFDDTQDIEGDLSGVGDITATGDITTEGDISADNIAATGNISATGNVTANNVTATSNVSASGITATTANLTTVNSTTVNNSGTLTTGNLSATTGTINTIGADTANLTTVNSTTINSTNINGTNGNITNFVSTDMVTEFLTVTKQAHFFKLIIDELKSVGGQVILTAANATLDDVEQLSNGNYRCYFKAKDKTNDQISNQFIINDQVICQTFNVATGTSYNVSNKYYWRLVVGKGKTDRTIDGVNIECHYIDLSNTTKDGTSIPEKGDKISQLGYRGTDDTPRQSAIIISAYQSVDNGITPPYYAQYKGINDFSLSTHRYTWFAANSNQIRGDLKVETGTSIEDIIDDIETSVTYLHYAWANSADGRQDFTKNANGGSYSYIGLCSNQTESDAALTYSDYRWSYVRGASGQDGTNGTNGQDAIYITVQPQTQFVHANQYEYTESNTTLNYFIQMSVGANTAAFNDFWLKNNLPANWLQGGQPTANGFNLSITIPSAIQVAANTIIPFYYEGSYDGNTYRRESSLIVCRADKGETGQNGTNGQNGTDAEFYKLVPVREKAIVDKNGNLGVDVSYQIAHVVGNNVTTIQATTAGYHVLIVPNNSTQSNPYSLLSVDTYSPSYTNSTYQTNYQTQSSQTQYFTAKLVYGSSHTIIEGESSFIPVIFAPAATLEITDSITATVQGHEQAFDALDGRITLNTNGISALTQNYDSISSTVTTLTNGDTKNLFYPSCYNSEGMSNKNNQWILTDILNGTKQCQSWVSGNLANYGKPMMNSYVDVEITANTGEVYIYSPYISLNKNYKYTLTFGGYVYNYCYLELCRYSTQARALAATSNITSTQQVAILGHEDNRYTYNTSVYTFTPTYSSSYYRLRFRLTNTLNSMTPSLNLSKISLYQGTATAGISAGGFAEWLNANSKIQSTITQKADEITIGLNRAGINLTSGKITSVADNFEWQNNEGETVLGLGANGDAVFKGTIKTPNLYHNICVWSPSSYYSNPRYCFLGSEDSDFAAFTQYHYYTQQEVYDLTDGYYGEPPEPEFCPCIGDADIVYMTSLNWSGQGNYSVNLPRPEDYEGKLVEFIMRGYGSDTYTSKIGCVVANKIGIGVLYVNENGNIAYSATGTYSTSTINVGTRKRFLSVKINSSYYWFELSELL